MKTQFVAGIIGVTALVLVGCAGINGPKMPITAQTVAFNPGDIGHPPKGFTTALTGGGGPGSWVVREDSTAPGGGPVLVQESAESINYRFPLCVFDGAKARDMAVETKFRTISGKLDEAGGLVLRYRPRNYYIARANALENNVILFKTVNGHRSHLVEVPASVAPGEWHTLRFEAKGEVLKVMLDGKIVMIVNDRTFSNPGQAGLWTKGDSVTAFAGFQVEPPPASSE